MDLVDSEVKERSNSFLELNKNDTVKEAENYATEVISRYQKQLESKLYAQLAQDSAEQVPQVLEQLVAAHAQQLQEARQESAGLRRQLEQATAVLQRMAHVVGTNAAAAAAAAPAPARSASSEQGKESMVFRPAPSTASPPPLAHENEEEEEGKQQEQEQNDAMIQEDSFKSFLTAGSSDDAAPLTLEEQQAQLLLDPARVALLLQAYHKLRGDLQLYREEKGDWQRSLRDLTQWLTDVTSENAALRTENHFLKMTTAPLEAVAALQRERDVYVCKWKEAALQAEQLQAELEATLVEAEERDAQWARRHAAALQQQQPQGQPLQQVADGQPTAAQHYHHPGLWEGALRELEEQAILSANQRHLAPKLEEAERRVQELEAAQALHQRTVQQLEQENEELRLDAQTLTFRNGVLSQQVASLLGKVQDQQRALRAFHTQHAGSPPYTREAAAGEEERKEAKRQALEAGTTALASSSSSSTSVAASSAEMRLPSEYEASLDGRAAPSESSQSLSPASATQHKRSIKTAFGLQTNRKAPGGTQTEQQQRDSARAAVTADALLRQRAQQEAPRLSALYSGGQGQDTTAATTTLTNATLLQDQGRGRPLPGDLLHHGGPTRSLLDYASLNTTFDASAVTPSERLELESSVRLRLRTYGSEHRRHQTVTLPSLGGPALEVSLFSTPRIPASDALTGVALGHPSSFSVLDPVAGSVSRHLSPVEQTALRKRPRTTAGDAAAQEDEEAEREKLSHEELLRCLDLLDEGDRLDGYSANSVTELVQRNQELLSELYRATQRADTAETLLCGSLAASGVLTIDVDENNKSFVHVDESRLNGRGVPAATHMLGRLSSAAAKLPHLLPPPTRTSTAAPATLQPLPPQAQPSPTQDSSQSVRISGVTQAGAVQLLPADVEAQLDTLVASIVDRHRRALSVTDETFSRQLLDLLQQRSLRLTTLSATAPLEESLALSLPLSLVELCTSQAVRLTQQAVDFVVAQQRQLAGEERRGWEEAQLLLQNTVAELQQLFLRPAEKVAAALAAEVADAQELRREVVRGEDEVEWLQQLDHLLRTAAGRDVTLQQVLAAAQERQREFIAGKTRRMALHSSRIQRLTAEARELAAPQTMLSPLAPGVGAGAGAAGGRISPRASPPPSTLHLPEATMKDSSRHPSTQQQQQPLRRSSSSTSVEELDDAELDEEESALLAEVRAQLALQLAKVREIDRELHEEKKEHMEMYERMWRLENERDAAKREKEENSQQMETMLTAAEHETVVAKLNLEYETVVADLDAAHASLRDLREKLRFEHEEHNKTRVEMDIMRDKLSHFESHNVAALQRAQAAQNAAQQESQALQGQLRQAEHHSLVLERQLQGQGEQIRHLQSQLQDGRATSEGLQKRVDALQTDFLSSAQTQRLLQQLYPEERDVLLANGQLVAVLAREKHDVTELLQQVRQQWQEAREQLRRTEREYQEQLQGRQDAEMRLQNITSMIAHSDMLLVQASGSSATAQEASSTPATTGGAVAPGVPLALQKRVLELEAQVATYQKEVYNYQCSLQEAAERERRLREQVDALGRDPISANTRKYGLKACQHFEGQIAEMNERNEAFFQQNQKLEMEKTALQAELEALQQTLADKEFAAQQLAAEAVQAQQALQRQADTCHALEATLAAEREKLQQTERQLQQTERQLQQETAALANARADLDTAATAAAEQQQRLQECQDERSKFFQDNMALMSRISDLSRELVRVDEANKAAEEALSRGMSRRGGGRARRRGTSQASFTQEISSIPPASPSPPRRFS